jgi:DNA repair protein RadD
MREGYLTELSRNGSQKAVQGVDMVLRQDWYSGLLFICLEKGYKEGYASTVYKQKFGTWPDGLRKVAKQPSLAVRSYVRSRQIAWAKSKQREKALNTIRNM